MKRMMGKSYREEIRAISSRGDAFVVAFIRVGCSRRSQPSGLRDQLREDLLGSSTAFQLDVERLEPLSFGRSHQSFIGSGEGNFLHESLLQTQR